MFTCVAHRNAQLPQGGARAPLVLPSPRPPPLGEDANYSPDVDLGNACSAASQGCASGTLFGISASVRAQACRGDSVSPIALPRRIATHRLHSVPQDQPDERRALRPEGARGSIFGFVAPASPAALPIGPSSGAPRLPSGIFDPGQTNHSPSSSGRFTFAPGVVGEQRAPASVYLGASLHTPVGLQSRASPMLRFFAGPSDVSPVSVATHSPSAASFRTQEASFVGTVITPTSRLLTPTNGTSSWTPNSCKTMPWPVEEEQERAQLASSTGNDTPKLPMLLGKRMLQSPAPKGSMVEEAKEQKPQAALPTDSSSWAAQSESASEAAPSASDRRADYVLDCMGLRHIYHCAGLTRKS